MRYNDLNEGQKRLCVVKFEMTHGMKEGSLIELGMKEENPFVRKTKDHMFEVLHPERIHTACDLVKRRIDEMKKDYLWSLKKKPLR